VTRTIRNIPTEVVLGPDDGMPTECAASFDNLRVVPKAYLVDRQCAIHPTRMVEAAVLCAPPWIADRHRSTQT
jgi:mRNA interferase MazF